jgi:predicted 2-oxoglutarate/Fe(II)-dependent dioxygenase YbiX
MHRHELDGDNVFIIEHFLSAEECARHIDRSEQAGYEAAPITTSSGFVMAPDVRSNARVMIDDPGLAAELWERVSPFIPRNFPGWEPSGLNERFRYYRYDVAETFAPHYDGYYQRPNGERSKLTLMIYLNEGFEGGETNFFRSNGALRLAVEPECGKALAFLHAQLHEGAPVTAGRKYVLRTDVMYRRVPESLRHPV